MTTTKNPTWVGSIRRGGFETSSGKTAQWKEFYKDAKKWWKLFVKEIGAVGFVIRENHFEFSGYLEVGKQGWYFNSGDVRNSGMGLGFLICPASSPLDFKGGPNGWVRYDDYFLFSLRNRLGLNGWDDLGGLGSEPNQAYGKDDVPFDGSWMFDEAEQENWRLKKFRI